MCKPAGRVLPPQQLFQGDVLSHLKSSLCSAPSSSGPLIQSSLSPDSSAMLLPAASGQPLLTLQSPKCHETRGTPSTTTTTTMNSSSQGVCSRRSALFKCCVCELTESSQRNELGLPPCPDERLRPSFKVTGPGSG